MVGAKGQTESKSFYIFVQVKLVGYSSLRNYKPPLFATFLSFQRLERNLPRARCGPQTAILKPLHCNITHTIKTCDPKFARRAKNATAF